MHMSAPSTTPFRRAAILGAGLIGGSFALALRKHAPDIRRVAWDREEALREAQARNAVDETAGSLPEAVSGADLIYVALPIGVTLDVLPEIAKHAPPRAFVTDACSTKVRICRRAAEVFRDGPAFLGGHPLAGKESSGIAHADADLFRGAKYALIGEEPAGDARQAAFTELLERIGARAVWLDAERHDWAVAVISHLPQLVSVALAETVHDELDETGLPVSLAGAGLRDALRLAGSPYPVWRDIVLTNTENVTRAIDRVTRALEDLRARLSSRELESSFDTANELYKLLRDLQ